MKLIFPKEGVGTKHRRFIVGCAQRKAVSSGRLAHLRGK